MKLANLHKLSASEPRFREMWGQASAGAYFHMGHYHHDRVIEDGGAIAEMHPSLTGRSISLSGYAHNLLGCLSCPELRVMTTVVGCGHHHLTQLETNFVLNHFFFLAVFVLANDLFLL